MSSSSSHNTRVESGQTPGERLEKVIGHAAHLLPAQGPIGVFIHHNTLHAFQHLPFEKAVVEAAKRFGTEPFLTEDHYRAEVRRGRIRLEDIDAILNEEPDAPIWPRTLSRRELRRALLWPGLRRFTAENIEWVIEEDGLLDQLRPDLTPQVRSAILGSFGDSSESASLTEKHVARALFAACYRRLPEPSLPDSRIPARPRDGVLELTGEDADFYLNPLLIRLAAAFLDQGQAYWPMPNRGKGFYLAIRELFGQESIYSVMPERARMNGLQQRFREQAAAGMMALDVVLACLETFGIEESEWDSFITAELLALPGWAGLMYQLERDPGLAPHEPLPCSLLDFLAVRLTMMEIVITNLWRTADKAGNSRTQWRQPIRPRVSIESEHMAAVANLYDAAQLLGLSAGLISSLSEMEFHGLIEELKSFDDFERRRLLHLAYERRHEREVLAPLNSHRRTIDPNGSNGIVQRPRAQVFFCIDEREESMRRALEEAAPEVETHGAAGFFGVAVNYRGLDDAHGVAFCPVVVTPQHAVIEKPSRDDRHLDQKRQQRRKLWADLTHNSFIGSRTLVRGWIGTIGLGMISLFPLLARVLAPRHSGLLYRWLGERFLPDPRTELTLMREDESDHHVSDDLLIGFTIEEKAVRVASVLRPAGVIGTFSRLSRLVVILGHGSTSLNNPHESAHDCGACGGRRGGPNARLFAAMANNPAVRKRVMELGIEIPEDTWFLGGYHDTCNDDVIFFDVEDVPASHEADTIFIRTVLDAARAGNALERSRRFEAAWADKTPADALRHVQERSEHLAEPRPEYGHATNAVAIVGRRKLTRGLFLDRRAFLISYDPTIDDAGNSLAALLGAAGPVCAGINLEYYFSFVDNERYGCGTKLPHNVTGLVGVMNGPVSDLRTGLPWQMVEVHEPVRLLLIVENSPDQVLQSAFRSDMVRELIENRWIRLVTIDPADGVISVYRNGVFEPFTELAENMPEFRTSPEWFLGKSDYLPIARIVPAKGSLRV